MSTDELANSVSSHQRRKSPALQRILQLYWPAFARTHALPGFVHRAAYLLAHCRTAILGGHVTRCEQGHVLDVYYNSCRHRGCPACTATPRANWLAKWQAKMLDTPAHHVIFTVPNELVPLWRMNKRLFTAALFGAASQSLLTLLADPQYLGAKPGLLGALHTWSQTLAAHPHCHFIVTSGGLADDATWKTAKKDCLLPCRVLMVMFRGKLLAKLRRLLNSGKLALPPERTLPQALSLLNRLRRTTWNVRLLERYKRVEGVAIYLAKYLRGGPIGNRRILAYRNGQVKFTYLDRRDRRAPRQRLVESCWRKPLGSPKLVPRAPPTHSRPAMATP